VLNMVECLRSKFKFESILGKILNRHTY